MTSGKSFAFQGHASALKIAHPESAAIAIARISEALLCMLAPAPTAPSLKDGIANHRRSDH